MKHHSRRAFLVIAMLFTAASLVARHSPSAVFDMTKRFTVSGTLTKVEWINPRIVVTLDAKGDHGKVENWRREVIRPRGSKESTSIAVISPKRLARR